jgi:hypothetical protein
MRLDDRERNRQSEADPSALAISRALAYFDIRYDGLAHQAQ